MENVKAKPIRLQQFGELMQRGLPPEPSEDEADESLVAKVMDERDRHNSLTDVNRTTSTMDEDGELDAFLDRYKLLIDNCAGSLVPGGKLAILIGDYSDREARFVPLNYWKTHIAFSVWLSQSRWGDVLSTHYAQKACSFVCLCVRAE